MKPVEKPASPAGAHESAVLGRVTALDGLRGLAALTVAMRHALIVLDVPEPVGAALLRSPLAVALNATGGVYLFFALSGFVLTASLGETVRARAVLPFVVRRICRIHPPYVAAVLLAWVASLWFIVLPDGQGSMPYRLLASVHIQPWQLLESLAFPSVAHGQLPVGWTLKFEMIYSLALPVMLVVARVHWLLLLAPFAWGLTGTWTPLVLTGSQGLLLCSLPFVLGLAAFLHRRHLADRVLGSPRAATLSVLIALFLYASPLLFAWSDYAVHSGVAMALGSVGLVVNAAFHPPFRRMLSRAPVVWLGKISYSFYLVHLTILVLFAGRVSGPLSWATGTLFMVAFLGTSLLVATVLFHAVEAPSMALGKRLSRRLRERDERVAARDAAPTA